MSAVRICNSRLTPEDGFLTMLQCAVCSAVQCSHKDQSISSVICILGFQSHQIESFNAPMSIDPANVGPLHGCYPDALARFTHSSTHSFHSTSTPLPTHDTPCSQHDCGKMMGMGAIQPFFAPLSMKAMLCNTAHYSALHCTALHCTR